VKGMGLPWQTALGCVFISACAFALLTAAGVRKIIISALPRRCSRGRRRHRPVHRLHRLKDAASWWPIRARPWDWGT